jgi:hypothetical protein
LFTAGSLPDSNKIGLIVIPYVIALELKLMVISLIISAEWDQVDNISLMTSLGNIH